LLLFIGMALLRLLLPDGLCLAILSGLSLGCLLCKPLSFPHFSPQRRCFSFLSTSHHLYPSDPEIRYLRFLLIFSVLFSRYEPLLFPLSATFLVSLSPALLSDFSLLPAFTSPGSLSEMLA